MAEKTKCAFNDSHGNLLMASGRAGTRAIARMTARDVSEGLKPESLQPRVQRSRLGRIVAGKQRGRLPGSVGPLQQDGGKRHHQLRAGQVDGARLRPTGLRSDSGGSSLSTAS